MSTCQVKTCKNDHRKKEFRNVHFYRFPKEKSLIVKWKEACGKENVNVKNGRICSAHFDAVAYKESSWMRPLLGYSPPQKRKLKFDAIPTLNLGSSISEGLDESAMTPGTAMNTILPEEQMEVSTSRHSLNSERDNGRV
ncbi:uncharacterized protein [Mycetomoellerius zeteki]|uniref:uncharacterized protein isoform X2 n=1 Tax=Mycetomoellerius zeteki TaxID=64791 RepID=UPI00084E903F|nr:PREDICTED: uncharacterized protein LOC108721013 isoform X2 [Trachymyrmex zeteki]